MGILDLFKRTPSDGGLSKHAERAQNKRAQAADRWDSIQALSRMGGTAAVSALLPRFMFHVEPSISDQDEKAAAFDAVVAAGDEAVEPVREFMRGASSLAWPLKILTHIQSAEAVTAFLLDLLGQMDTEYERDPEKKLQLLAELEERRSEEIVAAVLPFLNDVNETARFHAVGALLAQVNSENARDATANLLLAEESVRVKIRVADAFLEAGWSVEPRFREALPPGFKTDAKGNLRKR